MLGHFNFPGLQRLVEVSSDPTTSMAFEDLLLVHAGTFGQLHVIWLLIHAANNFIFGMNVFDVIFTLQTPPHSCHVTNMDANQTALWERLSTVGKLSLTSPQIKDENGLLTRDACRIYKNDSFLFAHLLQGRGNWTEGHGNWTEGHGNWTEGRDNWTEGRNVRLANTSDEVVFCSAWDYEGSTTEHTFVSEWDLVCGRSWIQGLIKSAPMIGQAIGVVLGGYFSDRLGRRPVGRVVVVISILMRCIMPFNPNLAVYIATRVINGGSDLLIISNCFILCSELFSPGKRAYVALAGAVGFAIGAIVIPLIGWLLPHWKHMLLCVTIIDIILYLPNFILPESPRWLYSVGEHVKAKKILQWIARMNRRVIPPDVSYFIEEQNEPSSESPGCCHFIKTPLLVVRVGLTSFLWFSVAMIFYGLALNVGSLAGSIYVNSFLMGLMDLPGACLISLIVNSPLGRRLSITISFLICSGVLLLGTAFQQGSIVLTVLGITGRFFVNIAFNALYMYTPEMFPTSVRSTVFAISTTCARFGSGISPFITLCAGPVPAVIFGVAGAVATLCVLVLPETKGRPLPATLEDMQKQHGLLCPCLEKTSLSGDKEPDPREVI